MLADRRRPRLRPIGFAAAIIVGGLVATLLVWPQLFGLHRAVVLSQIVAFRAPTAIALGVAALLLAALARGTKTWGVAAGLAIALGVTSIAGGAILLERGGAADLSGGEVTVVAWNTQGGAAPAASVARLVLEVDADIVSLPEMGEQEARDVARLLFAAGHPVTAYTTHGEAGHSEIPTSVLIAERLGAYEVDHEAGSTPGLPSVVLRPRTGSGPTIVAAHPFPPLPWRMATWRAGLQWVADQCDSADVIVAGDLNATVDHLSGLGDGTGLVGACDDAALSTGAAGIGTWPTSAPAWIASPIDHVLFGAAWKARSTSVVTTFDQEGSDHRPIVATLDGR